MRAVSGARQQRESGARLAVVTSAIEGHEVVLDSRHVVKIGFQGDQSPAHGDLPVVDMAALMHVTPSVGDKPRRQLRIDDGSGMLELVVGPEVLIHRVRELTLQEPPRLLRSLCARMGVESLFYGDGHYGFVVTPARVRDASRAGRG
jgi:hypothetical protein